MILERNWQALRAFCGLH